MDAAMNHSAAATAYEPGPSGQGETSAEDRIVPRHVPSSDRPGGDQAPEELGVAYVRQEEKRARAEAYQDQGLRALAYLDHIGTAVSSATSTLRWNSHDAAAVSAAMSSIRANLDAAQAAVDARADIVAAETALLEPVSAPAPEPQPEPAADPAPAVSSYPFPAEGYLVAATRAAEAVRSHAEQALMGFQFAPRETAMIFAVLDTLQEHAESVQRHYLDFVLAQDEEARTSVSQSAVSGETGGEDLGGDTGQAEAGAPAVPYIPSVHLALNEAANASQQAGVEAGRAVLAQSYEAHRMEAIGALEGAIAQGSLVLAGLKWDAEAAGKIAEHLHQVERLVGETRQAVTARALLVEFDAAAASQLNTTA